MLPLSHRDGAALSEREYEEIEAFVTKATEAMVKDGILERVGDGYVVRDPERLERIKNILLEALPAEERERVDSAMLTLKRILVERYT